MNKQVSFSRGYGTLVHPSSFPSSYGIGDFGPGAYNFIDFLSDTYQRYWQILPLNPIGYGWSPYASCSAFALDHYFIDIEQLKKQELLTDEECQQAHLSPSTTIDYPQVIKNKDHLFKRAFKRFQTQRNKQIHKEYLKFITQEKDNWLHDYALFVTCFKLNRNKPWYQWEEPLVKRDVNVLQDITYNHHDQIIFHYWLQFEVRRQWLSLLDYANSKGIKIIGDIPIYLDHNSVDIWVNRYYFMVDSKGNKISVAGVPPDYFSPTGQLWGNPLYRWSVLKKDNFSWWIKRIHHLSLLFNIIRIDHFRGFSSYWSIDANEKTAIHGKWLKGPGITLFKAIKKQLGNISIILEDLGDNMQDAYNLRDEIGMPGMKILQFGFDSDGSHHFLPHNFPTQCVVYSGSHDNNTALGWYAHAPEKEKHFARVYMQCDGSEINWDLIRLGMLSVGVIFLAPIQDFMKLGDESRTNIPGTLGGKNWLWRYTEPMLNHIDKHRLIELSHLSNRDGI